MPPKRSFCIVCHPSTKSSFTDNKYSIFIGWTRFKQLCFSTNPHWTCCQLHLTTSSPAHHKFIPMIYVLSVAFGVNLQIPPLKKYFPLNAQLHVYIYPYRKRSPNPHQHQLSRHLINCTHLIHIFLLILSTLLTSSSCFSLISIVLQAYYSTIARNIT